MRRAGDTGVLTTLGLSTTKFGYVSMVLFRGEADGTW